MPDQLDQTAPPPSTVAPAPAPDASRVMTLFVMIVATLYFGKEVLVPVTLALLLAFMLAPLVDLLRRLHLGRVPSVLLGVILALGVVLAIGGVIGTQVAELRTRHPAIRRHRRDQGRQRAQLHRRPPLPPGRQHRRAQPARAGRHRPRAGHRPGQPRPGTAARPRHRGRRRSPLELADATSRRSSRRWPRSASSSSSPCSRCCSARTCATG